MQPGSFPIDSKNFTFTYDDPSKVPYYQQLPFTVISRSKHKPAEDQITTLNTFAENRQFVAYRLRKLFLRVIFKPLGYTCVLKHDLQGAVLSDVQLSQVAPDLLAYTTTNGQLFIQKIKVGEISPPNQDMQGELILHTKFSQDDIVGTKFHKNLSDRHLLIINEKSLYVQDVEKIRSNPQLITSFTQAENQTDLFQLDVVDERIVGGADTFTSGTFSQVSIKDTNSILLYTGSSQGYLTIYKYNLLKASTGLNRECKQLLEKKIVPFECEQELGITFLESFDNQLREGVKQVGDSEQVISRREKLLVGYGQAYLMLYNVGTQELEKQGAKRQDAKDDIISVQLQCLQQICLESQTGLPKTIKFSLSLYGAIAVDMEQGYLIFFLFDNLGSPDIFYNIAGFTVKTPVYTYLTYDNVNNAQIYVGEISHQQVIHHQIYHNVLNSLKPVPGSKAPELGNLQKELQEQGKDQTQGLQSTNELSELSTNARKPSENLSNKDFAKMFAKPVSANDQNQIQNQDKIDTNQDLQVEASRAKQLAENNQQTTKHVGSLNLPKPTHSLSLKEVPDKVNNEAEKVAQNDKNNGQGVFTNDNKSDKNTLQGAGPQVGGVDIDTGHKVLRFLSKNKRNLAGQADNQRLLNNNNIKILPRRKSLENTVDNSVKVDMATEQQSDVSYNYQASTVEDADRALSNNSVASKLDEYDGTDNVGDKVLGDKRLGLGVGKELGAQGLPYGDNNDAGSIGQPRNVDSKMEFTVGRALENKIQALGTQINNQIVDVVQRMALDQAKIFKTTSENQVKFQENYFMQLIDIISHEVTQDIPNTTKDLLFANNIQLAQQLKDIIINRDHHVARDYLNSDKILSKRLTDETKEYIKDTILPQLVLKIQSSFAMALKDVLPSIERVQRELFRQIEAQFFQGLSQHFDNVAQSTNKMEKLMQDQQRQQEGLSNMMLDVMNMQKMLREDIDKISQLKLTSGQDGLPFESEQQIMSKLKALIQQQEYDQAFDLVFMSQKGNYIKFLVDTINLNELFPSMFEANINEKNQICLSYNLVQFMVEENDSKNYLDWVYRCLVSLSDNIQPEYTKPLEQVRNMLMQWKQQCDPKTQKAINNILQIMGIKLGTRKNLPLLQQ